MVYSKMLNWGWEWGGDFFPIIFFLFFFFAIFMLFLKKIKYHLDFPLEADE